MEDTEHALEVGTEDAEHALEVPSATPHTLDTMSKMPEPPGYRDIVAGVVVLTLISFALIFGLVEGVGAALLASATTFVVGTVAAKVGAHRDMQFDLAKTRWQQQIQAEKEQDIRNREVAEAERARREEAAKLLLPKLRRLRTSNYEERHELELVISELCSFLLCDFWTVYWHSADIYEDPSTAHRNIANAVRQEIADIHHFLMGNISYSDLCWLSAFRLFSRLNTYARYQIRRGAPHWYMLYTDEINVAGHVFRVDGLEDMAREIGGNRDAAVAVQKDVHSRIKALLRERLPKAEIKTETILTVALNN